MGSAQRKSGARGRAAGMASNDIGPHGLSGGLKPGHLGLSALLLRVWFQRYVYFSLSSSSKVQPTVRTFNYTFSVLATERFGKTSNFSSLNPGLERKLRRIAHQYGSSSIMWQRISGVVDFPADPEPSNTGQLIRTLATCTVDLSPPQSDHPHARSIRPR